VCVGGVGDGTIADDVEVGCELLLGAVFSEGFILTVVSERGSTLQVVNNNVAGRWD
jgi:hypothetical protein